MKKLLAMLSATLISIGSLAAAKVTFEDNVLTITGTTTSAQLMEVYSLTKDKRVDIVKMSGPGGEFYTGLRLGHLIKNFDALVIIPEGLHCYSACAMAAIAADHISVQGLMGFHRPYTFGVEAFRTPDQIMSEYANRVVFPTLHYMNKYNVPQKFTVDMFNFTSPCKYLTFESTTITKGVTNFMMYNTKKDCQRLNDHVSY